MISDRVTSKKVSVHESPSSDVPSTGGRIKWNQSELSNSCVPNIFIRLHFSYISIRKQLRIKAAHYYYYCVVNYELFLTTSIFFCLPLQ